MRKFWLIALPRKRMEFCINKGVFGLNRKYVLGRVQQGDGIACYVNGEKKIIALGVVTSEYYLDDTAVFSDKEAFPEGGLYPDRIGFKAEMLPSNKAIDFISLVDKLSFIKNLAYWSTPLSVGIVEMNSADWDLMTQAVKQTA